MKVGLLASLRCPSCRGALSLRVSHAIEVDRVNPRVGACTGVCGGAAGTPTCGRCARTEVIEGTLTCQDCHSAYSVHESVPRFLRPSGAAVVAEAETLRTAETFGHLWSQSPPDPAPLLPYHFEKMATSLGLEAPRGLIMDAGCGDGIDLSRHAARDGVDVIGVELSDGGCRTSEARTRRFGNAHVVQADLRRLPFAAATFDGVYSYGVLHHTASPPDSAADLWRVTKPGGVSAIYLYEDFGERALAWRMALAIVNSGRAITTRMPPRLLFLLCQLASPVVYLTCVVPYQILRRLPGLKGLAAGMPFRHGKGPFRLTGDLYDRFSAPIEYRYSRASAAALVQHAGWRVMKVVYERGWMVSARRGEEPDVS